MKKTPSTPSNQHAVVIGGSMAGLLAARVLSNHFERVTVIERDKINDGPESRRGQPQTRHLHGLLARGLQIMTHYFPDLVEALEAGGAVVTHVGTKMHWHCYGGYRKRVDLGMKGAVMSRPFLEWKIRERVQRIAGITFLDECTVKALITNSTASQITGVEIQHKNQDEHREQLLADLVIDASGRGSRTPAWLERMGYNQPANSQVVVKVGYASRIYERNPQEPHGQDWIFVSPNAPQGKRAGGAIPIEGNRWMVTLGGWADDHAARDEAAFEAFAKSLAAPDVYNVVANKKPLSDIVLHKFPSSQRRHYEKLSSFPDGLLLIGDAICSFNPLYGQGMTVAAIEASILDQLLQKRGRQLKGIAKPYFKKVAKVVNVPWRTAVGEDFRFPETKGKKALGTDFINAYVARIQKLSLQDEAICKAFLQVTHMIHAPTSLFRPEILWKVMKARF